ncbi:hypothetical protein D0T12_19615 [Actinomadura spongiicola]|uniref:Integral membrane protein n=1 Tax=Actinomadura spongiicola TaxID=2303421 RepID=A0A372GG31_9ACTN|nr:hypothetical protein [Actinomadura spongiicola]RFS84327.1 hypothetical protein D0T12_19615 [Actinomadura spongiicola]
MSDVEHANGGDEHATAPGGDAELRRLRAEVADLRARLAARPPDAAGRVRAHPNLMRTRRAVAALLVALAGFGLVASVIGVWGARTTLETDRWVATVEPLPENPEVNAAMATYLTDQVFTHLNVQGRIVEALPPRAAFLAGPVTDAVHDHLRNRVRNFMGTEQFAALWQEANQFAHAQFVAIAEGESETVNVQNGTVTLNLLPVINDVLVTVSQELPTLFGEELRLPALSSGEVPADLREKVATALGVTLPADFGQVAVYQDGDLTGFQDAVLLFERGIVLLVIGTLVCLALALVVSPGRRRTLLLFGVAVAGSAVVLAAVLRTVGDRLLERVPEGLYRQAASVAVHDVFRTLRDRGDLLLWSGVALAVLMYLVGPGRGAVALRRSAVSGLRAGWSAARSDRVGELVVRHLDVLRIAGVVVAALVVLLFASWTALLVILVVLAAYEVGVTLFARHAAERGRAPDAGTAPRVPPVAGAGGSPP